VTSKATVGKLNAFQRAMLTWDGLHPYNAIHVVRVACPLDRQRLERIVNAQLEQAGLTGFNVAPASGRFRYAGGPARIRVEVVAAGADPRQAVCDEITRQLNTPFPRPGPVTPFRFFAVPDGEGFALGLVYWHLISGADSIVALLARVVNLYRGGPPGAPLPVRLVPRNVRYPARLRARDALSWAGSFPRTVANLKASARAKHADPDDRRVAFVHGNVEREPFGRLKAAAKAWGVTLNDAFLAMLMKAVCPLASRRIRGRRRRVSVSSVVNTRKDLRWDASDTFGLFLGSFLISRPLPEAVGLEALARDIHAETQRIKKHRVYLKTSVEFRIGSALLSFHPHRRRGRLYHKAYPLWGGISNVNLDAVWSAWGDEGTPDYIRAVSTGPMTPLVLSITTAGAALGVGASYRTTVFSRPDVEAIVSRFGALAAEAGAAGG